MTFVLIVLAAVLLVYDQWWRRSERRWAEREAERVERAKRSGSSDWGWPG